MCANYIPVTRASRLLEFFGVESEIDAPEADLFPMGLAPFIRLAPAGTDPSELARFLDTAIFRFVPDFVAKVDWARKTYNARSETVDSRRNYKQAWAKGQRCIIPAESIYEPNYESGKSVRWRISRGDGQSMGIAGIFESWKNPKGEIAFSMAMLTVNADEHPFMNRFHEPGHEKRMVVILEPEDYDGWLRCPLAEAKSYCRQWHGQLVGEPAPLLSRGRAPSKTQRPKEPPSGPEIDPTGDLF